MMDMNMPIHKRGRKTKPVDIFSTRPIVGEDLARLNEERGTKPKKLQSINAKHRLLAQYIAQGMTQTQAAFAAGFTPSTVSILMQDEMFQGLVAEVTANLQADSDRIQAKLMVNTEMAVDELGNRLSEDPESFTEAQLLEVTKAFADRSGFGPSQKSEVNIKVGAADRLEAARQRVAAAKAKLINPPDLIEEAQIV